MDMSCQVCAGRGVCEAAAGLMQAVGELGGGGGVYTQAILLLACNGAGTLHAWLTGGLLLGCPHQQVVL
jgi:hypothetical protein